MSLTHYPHGILATPNVGCSKLVDMWNDNNIYFVDGVGGSDGYSGTSPDKAVAKISTAVNQCAQWGTVYIKPMQYTTYATITNRYYTDNVTIAIGQSGLSIVGAGPGGSHYCTTEIKTASASSHVFTVYAPGCQFENLRLTGTSQTAVTGLGNPDLSIIRAMGDGSTNKSNNGIGIRRCTFSNAKGGGAVRIDNPWNITIEDSIFHNCFVGIWTSSSVSSSNGIWIKRCQFEGQPANIDAHIYDSGGSTNCFGLLIKDCTFNTALPAATTGSLKRFVYIGDTFQALGGGLITGCAFATSTNGFGAAASQALWPSSILSAGNTYSAASAGTTTAGQFGTT